MTAPREDASALVALIRSALGDASDDLPLTRTVQDETPWGTREEGEEETPVVAGHLRRLCTLVEQGERTLQLLTDEQAAHKLTAETLAKAIRDGDKAEQYRVERDKAIQQGERDRRRLDWLESRKGRIGRVSVWEPRENGDYCGNQCAWMWEVPSAWVDGDDPGPRDIRAAIDAAMPSNDSAARTGQEG